MTTAPIALRRPAASSVAAVVITAAALLLTPPSAAGQPGPLDMNAQCRSQYPAADGFLDGQSYLVAPRDAYSWRCKRVSPTGGIIAELPVNPNSYCAPFTATPANNGTPDWNCTA
jgi:hypothetical protein